VADKAGISGGYATTEFDGKRFYVGYERTICTEHSTACDDDCPNRMWAFTVHDLIADRELYRCPAGDVSRTDLVKLLLNHIVHWRDEVQEQKP